MAVDWLKIKNEYVNGSVSYRALAQKYGVNKDTIASRAKAENWAENRQVNTDKTHTKAIQKTANLIAEREGNRVARMLTLADRLSDKLEMAITQLDSHAVINKRKVRTIEYSAPQALGKPSKEVIDEQEDIVIKQSIIDRRGLQQVATALKTINDVISVSDIPVADVVDDGLLLALEKSASTAWADDGEVANNDGDEKCALAGNADE